MISFITKIPPLQGFYIEASGSGSEMTRQLVGHSKSLVNLKHQIFFDYLKNQLVFFEEVRRKSIL